MDVGEGDVGRGGSYYSVIAASNVSNSISGALGKADLDYQGQEDGLNLRPS
jgi:hypothetical protein